MNKEEPQIFTRWIDPTINEYKQQIDDLNNVINGFNKWLIYKKEQLEHFDLDKRKSTSTLWYITLGEIDTFINEIKEIKEKNNER